MENIIYLLIEFLDELVYGIQEAAWPVIRDELALTYTQIGLLGFLPGLVSTVLEPVFGLLADGWRRRILIAGGGFFFAAALLLAAFSRSFAPLLIALMMFYPASGAFVSLSQADLMDSAPGRHNQNMARWTLAGSLGVTIGPLLLLGAMALGGSWRTLYVILALPALLLALASRRGKARPAVQLQEGRPSVWLELREGLRGIQPALKRPNVLRWLVLLEFADLMLDVLLGFLALYFTDVAGVSIGQAATGVLVWTVCGLLGDFLLVPLLEKVAGLPYLRWSVVLELVLFPAFLLVPNLAVKLVLLGLLGLFNSGWYAILRGELFSALPDQSGMVIALDNLVGVAGMLLPMGIALLADALGLGAAMWFLLAGPLALLTGLLTIRKI